MNMKKNRVKKRNNYVKSNKMNKQFKGYVFDFYDTLCFVDEEKFLKGKKEIARKLGIEFTLFFHSWKEKGRDSITGKLYTTYDRLSAVVVDLKLDIADEKLRKIAEFCDSSFFDACQPYPDAEETIKQLKEMGFSLFVLSNASASVEGVIHRFKNLFKYFNKIYFSYQKKLAKPDKRFFELLINNEKIAPKKYYYVGDGNDSELDVAKSFGFTTVKIVHPVMKTYRFSESKTYDHKIRSLSELCFECPKILKNSKK